MGAAARPRCARSALVAALLILAGCTSAGRSVDVDASATPHSIATYTIELQEMPGFLVPYFHDDLVAALAARGESPARIGMLSRAHAVATGAYMHERARAQIRRGFDRLLATHMSPRTS